MENIATKNYLLDIPNIPMPIWIGTDSTHLWKKMKKIMTY